MAKHATEAEEAAVKRQEETLKLHSELVSQIDKLMQGGRWMSGMA